MEGIGTRVDDVRKEGEFKESRPHGKLTEHMPKDRGGQILNREYKRGYYNYFMSPDLRFEDVPHFYKLDYPHQDREIGLEFAESTEE